MRHSAVDLLRLLPAFAATVLVSGCMAPLMMGGIAFPGVAVSPIMETGTQVYESKSRVALEKKAATGDLAAEYDLAESFCCHTGGPLDLISVYDNEAATQWFCRAAHADYVPAQMRLAEIYYGRPLHGFRTILYVSAILGDMPVDMPVALMWASRAARDADTNAVRLRERIDKHASPEQRERAAVLLGDWSTAPCLWYEVIPQARFK
jgi:TPR repeat protein